MLAALFAVGASAYATEPAGSSAADAAVAAQKAAEGTDNPVVTPEEQKYLEAKQQWRANVLAAHASKPGTVSPAACTNTAPAAAPAPQIQVSGGKVTAAAVQPDACGIPLSYVLSGNQQGQIYSNYCGPASLSEILGKVGHSVSQSTLASKVGISPNNGGTDVGIYGTVLNSYSGGKYHYAWQAVSYSPTSSDYSTYRQNLTADIITSYPVAGDAWEVVGGPHLTGHPNSQIFHWFMIRGYNTSSNPPGAGDLTDYEDSATTVWSSVPAYTNNFSSTTLTKIVGGRGYYW